MSIKSRTINEGEVLILTFLLRLRKDTGADLRPRLQSTEEGELETWY